MIKTDPSRDSLLDVIGIERLRDSYMAPGETSPQERYAFVSEKFSSNPEHAQRLYDYSSTHLLGYSTPVLSFGRNKRGMPISCFLNYVEDTAEGLVDNLSETNWFSMLGGGVGIYFGIRGQDEKSVGIIPHMKVYDDSSLAYKQGTTRRGSYAVYIDVSHPDIVEFLDMRKATGDQNRKCLNLHNAVNIPDKFMEIIRNCMIDPTYDDSWPLIDPHSGEVRDVVSAKGMWQKILELRAGAGRGEPYIHFIDNTNNQAPEEYKKNGLKVSQSNLCSEILLATDKDHSAVCCLSSFNLEKYDEWKDNHQFYRDIAEMLDNVLQHFIDTARPEIERAARSAIRERSIGIGVMGFHSYLQSKNIPIESAMAKSLNIQIFQNIRKHLDQVNLELGAERGEPPLLIGTGKRFTHLMAIAPTASNALICGNTSPSIEPWRANVFRQDTLSGTYTQKNKYLQRIIDKHCAETGDDDTEIWAEIIANDGSVRGLKWMDDYTKDVFKTASEIDQMWLVEHAADRQPFIDQGQSLNIFIRPDISIKKLHAIHFHAWQRGLKTMYYCRSEKLRNTDKVSQKVAREKIEDDIDLRALAEGEEVCLACEG